MRDIWVISDTHFGHENILKFKDFNTGKLVRGDHFDNLDHMDESMIDNWNSVVKPGDIVYHLGDVTFGDKERFKKTWSKLNGSKRLCVGNHDDVKWLSSGGFFAKVSLWRMWPEFGLIFSHVPMHINSLYRWASKDELVASYQEPELMTNIHGHIHQNPSPEGPYRCVCVEQINYTPVNIEELRVK